MSLLALESVTKRARVGRRERVMLNDVTLAVESGEFVSVWGMPGSGRTTLLRVASGLETPDEGIVRFAGHDCSERRGRRLGDGIGFAQPDLAAIGGQSIVDYVAMPLLARGTAAEDAREQAMAQLDRVDAGVCAGLRPSELDATEIVRVAIAQALVTEPQMLLIDDPTRNVDVLEAGPLLAVVRSIANAGVAVLMTTGEAMGVSGVDRALTISNGELRTEVACSLAPVVPLHGSITGARSSG